MTGIGASGTFLPPEGIRVNYGRGSIATLPDLVAGRSLLLVSTRSVAASGLTGQVEDLVLPSLAGRVTDVGTYAPAGSVQSVENEISARGVDMVVSLGGGSVIDTVKAAIHRHAEISGTFLPHISLPTTLSAAEFSPTYGVTDETTRRKASTREARITPYAVVLDPVLTRATPDWLWHGSGIRALDHAVESLLSESATPVNDATCLMAIRMLSSDLPRSSGDEEARGRCQIGAWLSSYAVNNVTFGLSHLLGRVLGPRYRIPHGHTSAILLPHVLDQRLDETEARQALIAAAMASASQVAVPGERGAGPAVRRLARRLNLPTRLRDAGVPENEIGELAAGDAGAEAVLRAAW